MNLNNIRLNIDEKTIEKNKKRKKRKKQIKNRFFHKKPFFIEIKNQKIKNGFLPNTSRASMDSSRQALQTDEKLFSNFGIIFRISYIFYNNSDVGFVQARRGRHLC